MNEIKDTVQVGLANVSAIGLSMAQVNEILTFVSLVLAITFTIYKFSKYTRFYFLTMPIKSLPNPYFENRKTKKLNITENLGIYYKVSKYGNK